MPRRFRHLAANDEPISSELVRELAPLVVDASQPFAEWYFNDKEMAAEIIEEWMARPSSEVYAGRAVVLDHEDRDAAGCLIALTGAELAKARSADFAEFCAEISDSPEADEVVEEVIEASNDLFPPVEDDHLYVSRVAVDPSMRGEGLGSELIDYVTDHFSGQGLTTCRLDVAAANVGAIKAYEKVGFKIVATSRSDLADLTYCAMELPLAS